jgi:anaerobic selenocysteine-containing dehydrogenase
VGAQTVYTFCRYCLASCGIEVTVEDNTVTKISPDSPLSQTPAMSSSYVGLELVTPAG